MRKFASLVQGLDAALLATLLFVGLLLAGCATFNADQLKPTQVSAICKALLGPIRYNSLKPESQRFAGALLALDLKQRNQVGQYLNCPAYR